MRLTLSCALLLLSLGCDALFGNNEQVPPAPAPGISEAQTAAELHLGKWREAIRPSLTADLASLSAPCPHDVPWPEPPSGPTNVTEAFNTPNGLELLARNMRALTFHLDRMRLVSVSEAPTITPPLVSTTLTRVRSNSPDLAQPSWWDLDIVLVVDEEVAAQQGEDGFVPGQLRGRAFLFDYQNDRMACAGAVTAHNSERIQVTELIQQNRTFGITSQESLGDDFALQARVDLHNNAMRAAVASLRALP